MKRLSTPQALVSACALLEAHCGLVLAPSQALAETLAERLRATGRTVDDYLAFVAVPAGRDELQALASPLTIGESYFLRHEAQWRALFEALPARLRAGRPLRVLSAGCSTGEEPYSLAMLAHEQLPDGAFAPIMAVDLSSAAIARARRACYSAWSLRALTLERVRRYFTPLADGFQLAPELMARVQFEARNALAPDATFWRAGAFDVILCRNVLIYFSEPAKQRLLERFATALAPGGILLLGPAESPRGLCGAFALRQGHEAFYYERDEAPSPPFAEALEGSTERLARLFSRQAELALAPHAADPLAPVRSLLAQERFAAAMVALDALPEEVSTMAAARLLRASALLNQGRAEEALALCEALGDRAEACHLSALCLEHRGDLEGAIARDERAIALEPRFALPRMHLARLARRLGRPARAQLERALGLIATESPDRLVPFAGGFSRAMLMQLCQAELRLCRGES